MQPDRSRLPQSGQPANQILDTLKQLKANDLKYRTGRVFAYVYEPDDATKAVAHRAYTDFLTENGLDPTSFPSLLHLETEIVATVAELLGGDSEVVGNFTTGGTESIILAVKTARDRAAQLHQITAPELIICETAHAAFHKAAHYLGVNVVVVAAKSDTYQIDLEAVEKAITPNTVLIVGSAPNYSHGVVDDIPALAALAKSRGILCHVDACVGGFYLPFARQLGYAVPPFDFSVEGVTSMSCDLHKYGYAPKGASVILHKNNDLRRFQIFTCSSWTGYSIINPTVLSSKSGGSLAAAWATMQHLGKDGYLAMNRATQEATQAFIRGIEQLAPLVVLGNPVMNLVAVASTDARVSVFEIADRMKARGWHLQSQLASSCSPEALHLNINKINVPHIDELLQDLQSVVAEILARTEAPEGISPEVIQGLFSELSPETFGQLAATFGVGEGGLPSEFATINTILNHLSTPQRDWVLTEFVNRMFVAR